MDAPATGEDRYRAEAWSDNRPLTITSHVFLTTGSASFGGGCSVTPEGDDRSWVFVSGLMLALGLVVRKKLS